MEGTIKTNRALNDEILKQKEFVKKIFENFGANSRKYIIHTFGCQMNEHDSEKLSGMLIEMGFCLAEDEKDADMIVFNTCCVRENAELKIIGNVGALKPLKLEKPGLIIAICGCMMQQEDVVNFIRQKFRHVDMVFGTHNLHCFPQMLYSVLKNRKRVIDVWEHEGLIPEDIAIDRKDSFRANVSIMYGCNNFCSYCIVPYVRGRERSRAFEDIVTEVEGLAKDGVREIMLLGQNVNSYGKDLQEGKTFARLLHSLNEINGLWRIRFLTSHPKDLSDELIFAIRDLKKVCNCLHLPFQSGSSRILKEMNRHYSKESYLELIERIRYYIPEISLSTDVIVGFPSESDEDFEDTLDIISKVGFELAYTFLYSKRSGTPAAKREDHVPESIMKERFQRLLAIQTEKTRIISEMYNGRSLEVLVAGESKHNSQRLTGRTESNKVINFDGPDELTGKLVEVRVDSVKTWSLEGTFVRVVKE